MLRGLLFGLSVFLNFFFGIVLLEVQHQLREIPLKIESF